MRLSLTRRAALLPLLVLATPVRSQEATPPKEALVESVAVFRAPGFPTADAPPISDAALGEALAGLPVETHADAAALGEALGSGRVAVLVLSYGSAFPLEAWGAIRSFLEGGGGLVVLGGAPFHQPVRFEADTDGGGRFVPGQRQPAFAHDLLIGPADAWTRPDGAPVRVGPVEGSGFGLALPEPRTVYALTLRLATRADLPDEHGSEGQRDALVRPLVHVRDADDLPVACPLLEIDRLRGFGAGARWVLAPSDAALGPGVIRAAVLRALDGAAQVDARPPLAAIEPGEATSIRVLVRRPGARPDEPAPRVAVTVRDERGRVVLRGSPSLHGTATNRVGVFDVRPPRPLAPGLYRAEVRLDAAWAPREATAGFWVKDAMLLASAPPLTASRDWLRRGGRVFPVVGTTYMASDVHRKFLFEPNPALWDDDFREMARRGVNFVRTGLWTAWTRAMLNPGAVDEGALRALDAFVLTAARHDIVVCFTFFAFLPPAYGGENPYLDPRALDGQRELLTAVARRYRGVHWVHYDLINEPTYGPRDAIWGHAPVGDRHERHAWRKWVLGRHGADPARLRDLWRDASEDADLLGVPRRDETGYAMALDGRRPRKTLDFLLFAQDAVARWALELREVLRAAGGEPLVTLGQDEGGTWIRPAQQLHAKALDYTSIHAWWRNDDLLSTGVLVKVPEKPSLHQEVGLMRLEDEDGNAWRDPAEARRALERKFALGFAARGAGVVEWAWNVNPYMPIDNESVIGFFRPDGTAKPELAALSDLAAFFRAAAPRLDDFEPDPVVVVIPHTRLFLGRPGDVDGAREVIRVLADRLGVVPTALSDAALESERLAGAKLLVLPSAEAVDDRAAQALLAATRAGARLLVTGAVLGDAYGRETAALRELGIVDPGRAVRRSEPTPWGAREGQTAWATFDHNTGEGLRRSLKSPLTALSGAVWHEPLPLERARESGPLVALLTAALVEAGVDVSPSDEPVTARVLRAPRAALVVCVNETPRDVRRKVRIAGRTLEVSVAAGRARLLLVDPSDGTVLAATPGEP
ncbi:MAG TPA: hypothetical protein VFM88_04555 [Vicinamibacteria bacterium]|nr:hypothetical protein [Vicinamibacteria bacterium]